MTVSRVHCLLPFNGLFGFLGQPRSSVAWLVLVCFVFAGPRPWSVRLYRLKGNSKWLCRPAGTSRVKFVFITSFHRDLLWFSLDGFTMCLCISPDFMVSCIIGSPDLDGNKAHKIPVM